MLSRHLIAATATAFLLFPATAPADGHVSAETVVATVNGTDITLGHLIVLKQRLPEQYQQVPTDVLFEGILNQVVQQTLLTETVEGPSRLVTLTLENEERTLKAGEAVQAIVDEDVSEDDARAIYDAVEWGEEYNASHILVETEEEAQALVTELEGGADFAELAREKSTGPSGPNGGELGWFQQGAMVPEFDAEVTSMDPETISGPVQTQFGWHVIRLNEKRDVTPPPFEQVAQQYRAQAQRAAVDAAIARLEADAEVTRMSIEDIDTSVLNDLSLISE